MDDETANELRQLGVAALDADAVTRGVLRRAAAEEQQAATGLRSTASLAAVQAVLARVQAQKGSLREASAGTLEYDTLCLKEQLLHSLLAFRERERMMADSELTQPAAAFASSVGDSGERARGDGVSGVGGGGRGAGNGAADAAALLRHGLITPIAAAAAAATAVRSTSARDREFAPAPAQRKRRRAREGDAGTAAAAVQAAGVRPRCPICSEELALDADDVAGINQHVDRCLARQHSPGAAEEPEPAGTLRGRRRAAAAASAVLAQALASRLPAATRGAASEPTSDRDSAGDGASSDGGGGGGGGGGALRGARTRGRSAPASPRAGRVGAAAAEPEWAGDESEDDVGMVDDGDDHGGVMHTGVQLLRRGKQVLRVSVARPMLPALAAAAAARVSFVAARVCRCAHASMPQP